MDGSGRLQCAPSAVLQFISPSSCSHGKLIKFSRGSFAKKILDKFLELGLFALFAAGSSSPGWQGCLG
jgi:hypothetical protein